MNADSEDKPDARPALQQVLHYHEITKHHFQGYAPGPGHLDGATQPNPFRRYQGARLVPLEKVQAQDAPLYEDVFVRGRIPPAPVTRQTISQLFYDSLAISAWKSTGESRWALRVNPSSGNLHPTEGYLICGPVDGLANRPMVCHYAPREHALEVRAEFEPEVWDTLWAVAPADMFLVGLTSIHWREAWKYGQRAYRYSCGQFIRTCCHPVVFGVVGNGLDRPIDAADADGRPLTGAQYWERRWTGRRCWRTSRARSTRNSSAATSISSQKTASCGRTSLVECG